MYIDVNRDGRTVSSQQQLNMTSWLTTDMQSRDEPRGRPKTTITPLHYKAQNDVTAWRHT